MRICIIYDCLYPWTIGGGERWLRALAEHLVTQGHTVTYVTRCQWDEGEAPTIDGVEVVAVSRREELYDADGRRTFGEPIRFGVGVHRYLRRNADRFDVVHVYATPMFAAIGASMALRRSDTPMVVDWVEVWTRAYWTAYSGRLTGSIGWLLQRLVVSLSKNAIVASDLHASRLAGEGHKGRVERIGGLFAGVVADHVHPPATPPTILFAGRHIPEKRVLSIIPALRMARRRIPQLHAVILGDGPDRDALVAQITNANLDSVVSAPGFVDADAAHRALGEALCLVHPSSREGYGIVVVEAAAQGTPIVVVAGDDNAATELIEEGVNGYVSPTCDPSDLAAAIVRVSEGGPDLRSRTLTWAQRRSVELSVSTSAKQVAEYYTTLVDPNLVNEKRESAA